MAEHNRLLGLEEFPCNEAGPGPGKLAQIYSAHSAFGAEGTHFRCLYDYKMEMTRLLHIGREQRSAPPYQIVLVTQSPQEAAARIQNNLRIAELERDVYQLKSQLRMLISERPALKNTRESDPCLADVIELTERMFDAPEVTVSHDPEFPENAFVVFNVIASGSPKEIVDKRMAWHEKVGDVQPRYSGRIRLSIIPKQ